MFGPARRSKDGLSVYCLDCGRAYHRTTRAERHGMVRPDLAKYPGLVFNLNLHNRATLNLALLRAPANMLVFDVSTGVVSKCAISTFKGGLSIKVGDSSRMFFQHPSHDELVKGVAKHLKGLNLRLEKDDVSLHEAKTIIYGFPI